MNVIKDRLENVIYNYNVVCVPTCGYLKSNGDGVVSSGFPERLEKIIPNLASAIGNGIKTYGNKVEAIALTKATYVVSFPIKESWYGKIDLELLERSCKQLMNKTTKAYKVLIPRLIKSGESWEDVLIILSKYFDDRVTILEED